MRHRVGLPRQDVGRQVCRWTRTSRRRSVHHGTNLHSRPVYRVSVCRLPVSPSPRRPLSPCLLRSLLCVDSDQQDLTSVVCSPLYPSSQVLTLPLACRTFVPSYASFLFDDVSTPPTPQGNLIGATPTLTLTVGKAHRCHLCLNPHRRETSSVPTPYL